ncbi:MAG: hypothetical protein K0S28_2501, partial [Paucimonas sp.]|nr:hypothetical protein [Paucimonas sp.]
IEETNGEIDGSFEGFECRWQNVPNVNGHKMSLLVVAMNPDPEINRETYGNVLKQIRNIYGDEASYHPLRTDLLQLSLSPALLSHEWRVRSLGTGAVRRGKYLLGMVLQNVAGRYLFKRKLDTKTVQWSRYRNDLVDNSDFRKFDGVLRMIIDGSDEQAMRLGNFLDTEFRAGHLAYGTHKSQEALVTCIVFSYNGNHLHFVDGSDGGYALAAKDLKQRVAEAKTFLKGRSTVQVTTSGA